MVALDPDGRVLLLSAVDPANPTGESWLELPGGGINPGEDSADTAERELYEEAGITPTKVGPVIWLRHTEFTFAGIDFIQDERIHVAWCDSAEAVRPQALESLEIEAFTGGGWWTVEDLLANGTRTWPSMLRELLPAIVAGELPDPPLSIGD